MNMARRRIRSVLLAATAAVALSPALATAQYDDSVVVDYSQIGGGSAAPTTYSAPGGGYGYAPPAYGSGGLRMPGLAPPPSRFYPPSGLPAASAAEESPALAPAPRAKAAAAPVDMPAAAEASAPAPKKARMVAAKPAASAVEVPSAPPAPPAEPVLPTRKLETPAAPPSAPPAPPASKKTEPPKALEVAKVESPKAPPKAAPEPPAPATGASAAYKVVFAGDAAAVPPSARDSLKAVADRVNANEEQRVQLAAYAAGDGMTPSSARRLSLSRALAVRSYLIDSGVRSSRIDVRALGDKVSGDPANRVDVTIVDR